MSAIRPGDPSLCDPYAPYSPPPYPTEGHAPVVIDNGDSKRSAAEYSPHPLVPPIVGMPSHPHAATFITIRPPSDIDEAVGDRHDTAIEIAPPIGSARHKRRVVSGSVAATMWSTALTKRMSRPEAAPSTLMTSRLEPFRLEALGKPYPPVCSEETERKLEHVQKNITANKPIPISARVCGCFSRCCIKEEETRSNRCLNMLCQFRASFISLSCCLTVTSSVIQSIAPYMWTAPDSISWPPPGNFVKPLFLNAGVAAIANASTQDHAINTSSILAKANAEREHVFHALKRQYTEMAKTLLDQYTSASSDHVDVVERISKEQFDEFTLEIDSIIKTRHKTTNVATIVQLAVDIETNFSYIRKTLLDKFGPVDINVLEHLVDAVNIVLNSDDINNEKPPLRPMVPCDLLRIYTSARDEQARKVALEAKGIKENSKLAYQVAGLAKAQSKARKVADDREAITVRRAGELREIVNGLQTDLARTKTATATAIKDLKQAFKEKDQLTEAAIAEVDRKVTAQTEVLGKLPETLTLIIEQMTETRTSMSKEIQPVREGLVAHAKALDTVREDAAATRDLVAATGSTVEILREADGALTEEQETLRRKLERQQAGLYVTRADVTKTKRTMKALTRAVVTLDHAVTAIEIRPPVVRIVTPPMAILSLPSPAAPTPEVALSSPPHMSLVPMPAGSVAPPPATLYRLPFAAAVPAARPSIRSPSRTDRSHQD